MHSQNAQAGVSLKPLHFEDAEIAKQGEDTNMEPEVPQAEVVAVAYEPRFPAGETGPPRLCPWHHSILSSPSMQEECGANCA